MRCPGHPHIERRVEGCGGGMCRLSGFDSIFLFILVISAENGPPLGES
jgi:hypothetical protein